MPTMISREQIEDLVRTALTELAVDLDKPELANASPATVLFGPEGALDSLGLVHLIADVESRVAEATGREIIIADERAMSRSRSPFRTIETLVDYLAELLRS